MAYQDQQSKAFAKTVGIGVAKVYVDTTPGVADVLVVFGVVPVIA